MVQFPSTPRPTPTPGPTGRAVPTDTLISSRQYVWDGWLCIAEIVEREELRRSHTWGLDLSGDYGGAGGVGGLVFLVNANDIPQQVFQCFYDGNGNLTSLRDDSQAIAAQYDYGPFGELLTARGDYAAENPYRFSTKYADAETGLYYYGYRYYNSSTGRWLSRDPIGEEGGLNLYGFVGNASVMRYDYLGLACGIEVRKLEKEFASDETKAWGHWWICFPNGDGSGYYPNGWRYPNDGRKVKPWKICGTERLGDCSARRDMSNNWDYEEPSLVYNDLQHGIGAGKSCACASCDEIVDCLRNAAPSEPYFWATYNCRAFVKDALQRCCLKIGDCRESGAKPKSKPKKQMRIRVPVSHPWL